MARLLSKSPEISNSPITATKDARNLGKSLQTVVLAVIQLFQLTPVDNAQPDLGNLRNLRPPEPNGVSSTSVISFSLGLVSSLSSSSMRSSSTCAAVVVVVNFLVGFLVPGLRVVVVVRLTTGFFVVETGFLEDVGFLTGALVDRRVTDFLVVTLGGCVFSVRGTSSVVLDSRFNVLLDAGGFAVVDLAGFSVVVEIYITVGFREVDSEYLEYSWTFVVDEETNTALGSSASAVDNGDTTTVMFIFMQVNC
uniref:Uncharacterized protein n=1 Tax=Glossina palpalis gambiensis TaxID=67801 RepID=A0A1B0BKG9_9MUSC